MADHLPWRHITKPDGTVVYHVETNSPEALAERLGFKPGQLVWSADGKTPRGVIELIREAWVAGGFQVLFEQQSTKGPDQWMT